MPDLSLERTVELNELAWDYWRWAARQSDDWTRAYLASRGLRGTTAGLAPDGWRRLVPTLGRRGIDEEELVAAGLAKSATNGRIGDAFRDRLVLPIRDQTDRLLGFTARRNPTADEAKDAPPKYLNSPRTAAFDKSATLYGLDATAARRLAAGASPVLVEGGLDVEAAHRAGTDYVPLGACGTAVTSTHLQAVRDIDPAALQRLVTAFDPDLAGTRASVRVWSLLTPLEAGEARAATLPDGADPADLVKAGRRTELRTALEEAGPLTHAVVDHRLTEHRLTDVEGRLTAVRAIVGELKRLDPYYLSGGALHLAEQIGPANLARETILAEVVTAVRGESEPDPPQLRADHNHRSAAAIRAVSGRHRTTTGTTGHTELHAAQARRAVGNPIPAAAAVANTPQPRTAPASVEATGPAELTR
ncbi:toprim domain-containing protein [Antribacter gilvus]|uniref:toprim domain-containing protein n=1 Tax=Antribacter gilvus TaxID=2304675 RepID=UPI000F777888|nr:toprim domain-containing protein [Antribacter gilvus]